MSNKEKACIVCGYIKGATTVGHSSTCNGCGIPLWVSETAEKAVLAQGILLENIEHICHKCVPKIKFQEIIPMSDEQIQEIREAGIPEKILKDLKDPEILKEKYLNSTGRIEHLAYCKERALKETTIPNMLASFIQDLASHESTKLEAEFNAMALPLFMTFSLEKFRHFITNYK